jgi:VWFA-related protein
MIRRKIALLVCGVALALATDVIGQQPTQPRSQFRAGIDLVTVDFVAVDSTGKPVNDLKPGEVTLKVDGKARPIRALEFLRVAPTSAEAPVPPPILAAPFGTNESSSPGRMVIIVVDEEHLGPGDSKGTIDAAGRFLDRLTGLDRVGLVTLPNGAVAVDLTTNHDRVRQALATLVGKGARLNPFANISLWEALQVRAEQNMSDKQVTQEIQDRECRFTTASDDPCRANAVRDALMMAREVEISTRSSVKAIRDFFDGIAHVEGPKSVIFISGSLIPTEDLHDDLQDIARSATLAHAQLYVIQPHEPMFTVNGRNEPMSIEKDTTLRVQGLEDFATSAGGVFFRLSSAGDTVFTRIADEISAYYLLGFEPTSADRDGKRHSIDLTTSRRTVTLRSRPAFIFGGSGHENTVPLVPETLLRDFAIHRDLPLRATAYPFRSPDPPNLKIVVAVEPLEPGTTLTSAAFALFDTKGRAAAMWNEEGANVVLRPLLTAAALPAGEYRLRVAAVDTLGRRGAVDYEFMAGLTKADPVALGTLMLGAAEQGAFKPRLSAGPTTTSVTAYLELYGDPPIGTKLNVTLELAATPDGPALASAVATLLVARAEPDRRVATGEVPIALAPVGDSVIRAVVTLDGKVIGRVWRTLRKDAR